MSYKYHFHQGESEIYIMHKTNRDSELTVPTASIRPSLSLLSTLKARNRCLCNGYSNMTKTVSITKCHDPRSAGMASDRNKKSDDYYPAINHPWKITQPQSIV